MTVSWSHILFNFSRNHENSFSRKKIPIDEGEECLDAILGKPSGQGSHPAILIAPGQGYPMERSLFQKIALNFREQGFITLQFNWRFYSQKTNPSDDFVNEIQGLKTCLAYLRSLHEVNKNEIFVIGKSLGSLVGIDVASSSPDFKGLVLLTVALHPPHGPYEFHPKIEKLREIKIPVSIITGEKDPICKSEMLHKLLTNLPHNIPVFTVPGDHQFRGKTEEETGSNEDLVVEHVLKIVFELLQEDSVL